MTLIKQKFKYETLERRDLPGGRKYLTPEGTPVPSVTTILSATKDKSHLIAWRKRVGEQKANEITTTAASRGTRMHKYLEAYVDTGEWPSAGGNPYAAQAHKMATIVKDKAFGNINEIWGSEVTLYMPHMYAGTTDLIGLYNGNPAVIDFKQTNKPKKAEWIEDYYIQATMYGVAHNELFGTDIKEAHILMCSADLEYQQFDIWPDEWKNWEKIMWARLEKYYSSLM
jgi:ATP-dependent exoDNAse (exonuclease V) beta subunit